MYETSVLIFNNLFTGNDFTQNIEWVDSKLNLKYDFLKCSWNSYCFKYKLAIVPEGMNIFHYLTAANLIAQFYLCSLYSLYFPIKGWRSLLCCSAACLYAFPGNVRRWKGGRRSLLDRHTAVPVPDQTWLSWIHSIPKGNQQLHEMMGIFLLSKPACHLGTRILTAGHTYIQIKSENTFL